MNIEMRKNYFFSEALCIGLLIIFICCCENQSKKCQTTKRENRDTAGSKTNSLRMQKSLNPVVYFEIPVNDIDRAIKFYKTVFYFDFYKETIDKNEMALFPFTDNGSGVTGALAKGDIYKPTKNGVLIYFKTENIDETLKLVQQNGGQILYPKTTNGDLGFVAEFEDTEGNRIALHMKSN
jgi:uncharacterized protein